MKKLLLAFALLIGLISTAQVGQRYIPDVRAYIDLSKPPYNMTAGMSAALACEQAIDSLDKTYHGGTVLLPYNYNWNRPNSGSQKGVRLRSNITVLGVGNRLTLINNCPWFTTDFGTDSLGFEINGTLDSSMRVIPVVTSAGAVVGDTVFGRFGTAVYDAGEPKIFGWFIIVGIPDGTHITIDRPCQANMVVAGTVSLNRRLIRVKKRVQNVLIKNLEFYSTTAGGGFPEAGVYAQGGVNIVMDNIHGTNVGTGLANYQFTIDCVLQNSFVDSCDTEGNANWGRGITISESIGSRITGNTFEKWRQTAINNEANNPGAVIRDNIINNTWDNTLRLAITSLGSGDIIVDNNRFGGYQMDLYGQVNSTGSILMSNTTVDVGTPFRFYEQQGIYTTGFLNLGGLKFYGRKTYSKSFLIPINNTYTFDSLPKGFALNVRVTVDDTTGIRNLYLRRDNTFTNNQSDFASQLRSRQTISPSIGATFYVGQYLLASTTLNYNLDKGFVMITDATVTGKKWCTITMDYLESTVGPYNQANGTSHDIDLRGVYP